MTLVLTVGLGWATACTNERSSRPASPDPAPREATAENPVSAGEPQCSLAELPAGFPDAARVVAIGDLHGDLDATRAALRLAGAIDETDQWIGGDLVVVQTGDILDRGDGEQEILDLFEALAKAARAAGGAVHVLNGNHELMNAVFDFRYVTKGGFADFEDVDGLDLVADRPGDNDRAKRNRLPARQRARAAAFAPGGPYARVLAGHNAVVVVGDTVFVHGGVLPAYAGRDLVALNREVRCWLAGAGPEPAMLHDSDGPLWTTRLSAEDNCELLGESLRRLGAKRMVMGHEVQRGGITASCDGHAWRIDTGLAALYGGPIEVLEITANGVRPLHGERR